MTDETNILDFESRAASETPSTAPMACINDASCLIEQVIGIADLLTAVEAEDLVEGTIHKVGYAIEGILTRARARLAEAKEARHG